MITILYYSGVFIVVYKNAKLFKTAPEDKEMAVVSDFNFNGVDVKDSDSEIKLAFKETANWVVNDSYYVRCVFWEGEGWSEDGCRYDITDKACFCNHATPFTSILVTK